MLRKSAPVIDGGVGMSFADRFYALIRKIRQAGCAVAHRREISTVFQLRDGTIKTGIRFPSSGIETGKKQFNFVRLGGVNGASGERQRHTAQT